MAKLLYSLKLALMGTITTRQQELKIRAFADFITHIYATWWLACAIDVAWNDFTHYHHLCVYKSVGVGIIASAFNVLEWHLWYLMEHRPADLRMRAPQLRFGTGFGKLKFPALSPTTSLADLANPECLFGMHQLHVVPAFLSLDVEDWATSAAFQAGAANVRTVNVVNDCAERGVKLTSDFVAAARSEQHLQNVLQAVEHDRSKQPHFRCCKRKLDISMLFSKMSFLNTIS
ncbi:hypothetical protein AAFF_G00393190 [Aldrovandia affinis]|uniref:Uncharacterized protein n=1 Tax=Aldrovandia affinis TaxID=143900 RepID=A0AAD7SDF7_9TELE|nr:hypothetical protein AAFF_G00393190 [Aldrovandia affinis]